MLPSGIPERGSQQVDHAGLHDRFRPHLADCVGQPFEPVADHDARVRDAAVLQLGEDLQPELGALAAVTGPQAQDVPGALDLDCQGQVDRPVGDLPVADLHVHRIQEDHRVDRVQGAGSATRSCPRSLCR